MLSVAYSGEPYSGPLALTVGLRRSDAIRSCRYLSGVDQSQVVTTMLRSTPVGRGGLAFGSSPLATRSVQSPKYLYGAPPNWPAMRFVIISPDWPEVMRRMPRLGAGVELAELRRDRPRRLLAELMTADAVGVVHLPDPVVARDVLRDVGVAAEILGRRNLHHRVPVDRRIVVRRRGRARRGHRRQVELSGRAWRASSASRRGHSRAPRPDSSRSADRE